jgi:Ca2+-transporting ATPase
VSAKDSQREHMTVDTVATSRRDPAGEAATGTQPPDGMLGGLSSAEASRRLGREGYNELPASRPRSIVAIALGVVREPMFLLLIAAGTVYLLLGDLREALMLLGFVFVVMGITLYQERKTERALETLRDLTSPRALVIRDGARVRIAGRDVVRGDLLVLAEGDRVPADALLLSATNLSADESLLTGESVPVRKVAAPSDGPEPVAPLTQPGGDDQPLVYASTLIVQGQGVARVVAIGERTAVGRIGTALREIAPEQTPLQRQTGRWVRALALAGGALCVVVALLYALTRHDWLNGILAGIALAMAMLPEELPVVLTVFLALGAWRIAQRRVLTRRVPAVETLGAATVLCVDKTGTLTLNRMAVQALDVAGEPYTLDDHSGEPLPEMFHALVEFGRLASQRDPFDPMEQALHQLSGELLARTEHLHPDWELEQTYPLSSELLAMSEVWRDPDGQDFVIAAKGAPEAIVDLCHLDAAAAQAVHDRATAMARTGLRTLAVARAYFRPGTLPPGQHTFAFSFLGLIGFVDPIRPSVPAAIAECRTAGIRVVMITGDYPVTAQSIAAQIGLDDPEACITGPELQGMADVELARRVRTVNVFARVVPEQKLRLVRALKANGEVVAMTGDGVNDAPALKAADIGIAMGGRGTDVAREAAALVLLDDDFAAIVQAVRMGRRIYDNLKKAMAYILAIHVPIAGLSLLPVLLGWPLILLPIHIVFLELVIDPACSVVFEAEPEERDVMARPPRDPAALLFDRAQLALSLGQGASVLAIVAAVFVLGRRLHGDAAEARALAVTTLLLANLALILTNRSWSRTIFAMRRARNAALGWVVGGTVVLLALVLAVPALRGLFAFSALHIDDVVVCVAAAVASILWFEGLKLVRRRGARSRTARN